MPIDQELLDILVCPESREKLTLASDDVVDRVNARVTKGTLRNRAGQPVKTPVDGGLVRPDGKFLYPIQDEIPNLLIDEAIPLTQLE